MNSYGPSGSNRWWLDRGHWGALCGRPWPLLRPQARRRRDLGILDPTKGTLGAPRSAGTARLTDYRNRNERVSYRVKRRPHSLGLCSNATPQHLRLSVAGQPAEPLPEWHHPISGSHETVHEAGQSTRGWTVSEEDAGDLEIHVVESPRRPQESLLDPDLPLPVEIRRGAKRSPAAPSEVRRAPPGAEAHLPVANQPPRGASLGPPEQRELGRDRGRAGAAAGEPFVAPGDRILRSMGCDVAGQRGVLGCNGRFRAWRPTH